MGGMPAGGSPMPAKPGYNEPAQPMNEGAPEPTSVGPKAEVTPPAPAKADETPEAKSDAPAPKVEAEAAPEPKIEEEAK